MSHRLPSGGLVDRSRRIEFSFNGVAMHGHPGDTLASALLANGVRVVARSFKFHRPRGIYAAGVEDPCAMLAVRDAHGFDPALRAGQVLLAHGLEASSVSGWPSLRFDAGAIAGLVAPLLPAGFYYKTFKWPSWSWFEGAIRRSTGYGRPRDVPDARRREHRHDTCDVLVIGAGPAGLAAARALVGSGLRTIVVDAHHRAGGTALWEQGRIDGVDALAWAEASVDALRGAGTTVLCATTVTGAYEGNFFTLVQAMHDAGGLAGERLWKLRARHVVLATGAIDRPLVFQDNDRPGVMLAGTVRRHLVEYAVAPGHRLAVHGANDSGYLTAIAAKRAGIEVAVLVDTRPRHQARLADLAEAHGIPCVFDAYVAASSGRHGLRGITVQAAGRNSRHACDALALAGGFTPLIHLAAHRGARPVYDTGCSGFVCTALPPGWHAAGGVTGTLTLNAALRAGHAAASAIAATDRAPPQGATEIDWGETTPAWCAPRGVARRMWVDLQNDVTAADVALAVRENFLSVEHLKRYTTLGMGTDQGRTSNVNGLALLALHSGRDIAQVGSTTFRPPYIAMRMGTVARHAQGDLYRPRRFMPAHRAHCDAGAVFEDFGWERPDWYRCNGGQREAAVLEEMIAVRNRVGVFDASPLGKVEVTGPDARVFLDRMVVSDLSTLEPGRARYTLMLEEDGVIFDDGVLGCLADDHFLAGPSSGNAEAVVEWLERWRQTEWPDLRVAVTDVTSAWACIALAGPGARTVLEAMQPDFDVGAAAFPHMGVRQGRVCGVAARVARVSFTGELQFELSVPARFGDALFRHALECGAGHGAVPVGIEAWLRLRTEKGYLHVGTDTNGRTTPADVGMQRLVARKAADFVGKRSLSLAFPAGTGREQLVGLRGLDGPLEAGGRVLGNDAASPPCVTVGYVTSACRSPSLSAWIGLALIEDGAARHGERVRVHCTGGVRTAQIVAPVFLDLEGRRLDP